MAETAPTGRNEVTGGARHHAGFVRSGARLVFWETTKACPLACVHCRATAQRWPAPGELTTEEAKKIIDELAAASRPRPVLILTGGDCLQRPDLAELTGYAPRPGSPGRDLAVGVAEPEPCRPDLVAQ